MQRSTLTFSASYSVTPLQFPLIFEYMYVSSSTPFCKLFFRSSPGGNFRDLSSIDNTKAVFNKRSYPLLHNIYIEFVLMVKSCTYSILE